MNAFGSSLRRFGAAVLAVISVGGVWWLFSSGSDDMQSGNAPGVPPGASGSNNQGSKMPPGRSGVGVLTRRAYAAWWSEKLSGMDQADPSSLLARCEAIANDEARRNLIEGGCRSGLIQALLESDYQRWYNLLKDERFFREGLAGFWLAANDLDRIEEMSERERRELLLALRDGNEKLGYPGEFIACLRLYNTLVVPEGSVSEFDFMHSPSYYSLVERAMPEGAGRAEWFSEVLKSEPRPEFRENYRTQLLIMFFLNEPGAALQHMKDSGLPLTKDIAEAVGKGLSKIDPSDAFDWISSQDPEAAQIASVAMIRGLTSSDPRRASQLILDMPFGPTKSACAAEMVRYLEDVGSHEEATAWRAVADGNVSE